MVSCTQLPPTLGISSRWLQSRQVKLVRKGMAVRLKRDPKLLANAALLKMFGPCC